MKILTIGLDFDDVIGNSHQLKVEAAKSLYGVTVDPVFFQKRYVVGNRILSDDQYRRVQHQAFAAPVTMIVEGALETIARLKADGHILKVVTARFGESLEPAKAFVCTHCEIPIVGVGYGNSKAEAARGSDVFFDDDETIFPALVGVVPHLFLHDRIFNQSVTLPEGVRRVNWAEFYDAVCEIAVSS